MDWQWALQTEMIVGPVNPRNKSVNPIHRIITTC
jgi:hypothetical protein